MNFCCQACGEWESSYYILSIYNSLCSPNKTLKYWNIAEWHYEDIIEAEAGVVSSDSNVSVSEDQHWPGRSSSSVKLDSVQTHDVLITSWNCWTDHHQGKSWNRKIVTVFISWNIGSFQDNVDIFHISRECDDPCWWNTEIELKQQ